jgi:hypothetical protein
MGTIMTPEQMLTMTAQLEVVAAEIRNAGHPGWGNICADAADLIRQIAEAQPVAWVDPAWFAENVWTEDAFERYAVDEWIALYDRAAPPAPHDDTALLRQALDALENRCGTNAEERAQLIPALRARLDGAPQSTAWRSIDEPLNYLTKGEDGQQFLNSVTMPKHAKQWAYQAPQPDDTALPSRHPGPSGSRTTTRTTCHETQDR